MVLELVLECVLNAPAFSMFNSLQLRTKTGMQTAAWKRG